MRNLYLLAGTGLLCLLQACSQNAEKPMAEAPNEPEVQMPDWLVVESDLHCYPVDENDKQPVFNNDEYKQYISWIENNKGIWHRLQENLEFQYVPDRRVEAQLNWYKSHPAYMERVQQRAERYIYFIMERLREENIPMDFALLPVVESAYQPFAYSHGQASGLWQFIPGTGRRFKLEKNWWFDGRRDVVDSTNAAIAYLKYLHGYFGNDWLLAIAAYNSGEGTVRRAIRKNKRRGKPTDFWHLDLPRETEAYVPKMIALSHLFKNADAYNMPIIPVADQPYFTMVELDSQLDLAQAASLGNISMEEIYYLNPGLSRWATPPANKYLLKIPVTKEREFVDALSALSAAERVVWHRHKIQSGENLSLIAAQYNTHEDVIMDVNNLSSHRIIAGDTLMIPKASLSSGVYQFSAGQRLSKRQNIKPVSGAKKIEYYVQPGDSFWKISQQYKVSHQSLAKWNGKSPRDTLKVGEKLVVWSKDPFQLPNMRQPKMTKVNYRVRKGDSLAKVASKFNVRINQIVSWNNINPDKYLQPGQSLKLYINVMDAK